ncbi:MAG: rhodanese-like domain-containing protein [Vicinamibacterales bacterium]
MTRPFAFLLPLLVSVPMVSPPIGLDEGDQDPVALAGVARVSQIEFAALRASGRLVVVDVRQRATWRKGHIPGALSVPLQSVEAEADALIAAAAGRRIVTYCSCSAEQTSARAVTILARHGAATAAALAGGFDAWVAAGGRPAGGLSRQ